MIHPLLLAACVLAPALALRSCWPMDEIRYLELIREMHERGNWLALTLEGQPYAEKTPFLLWQVMAVGTLTGLDLAARLVPALHALLLVFAIKKLTEVAMGGTDALAARRAACFAAVSPGTFFLGQSFLFDMPLAVYALLGDALALEGLARNKRVPIHALLWIGFAVLMKGPVALLHTLPVIALGAWHFGGRAALLPRGRWTLAALVIAGPLLLWALAFGLLVENGFERLWNQVAGRVSGGHGHQRPWWLYAWVMPVFALPWCLDLRRLSSGSPLADRLAGLAALIALGFVALPTRAVQYLYPEVMLLLPWAASAVSLSAKLATTCVRALAVLLALVALAVLVFPVASWLANHGGRNGPVLARDLLDTSRLWPALALLPLLGAALARIELCARFALILIGLALGAFPMLDRTQEPERSLPVLGKHLENGGTVVQFLPIYDGNFHWYLGRTLLPIAASEAELDQLVAGKDALVFGFEKQLDEPLAHHRLVPVVHESFFFRSFFVWRAERR